jgi:AcrR family transcriptional regulator
MPAGPSAAQARIIGAALDLFAERGVGGTSLHMIADKLGVTKAAVYHQYNTKEAIILAVGRSELGRLEAVVGAAEQQPSEKRARDALLAGIVDLAIERGRKVSTLLIDPVMGTLFARDVEFHDVMHRIHGVLGGDDAPEAHVRTSILLAAISGAVMHPFSANFDDEVVRSQLLLLARRFLGLRG